MIGHQRQPSPTSCGPTCVAMLVARPVQEVLSRLPEVRVSPRRKARRDHRVNIGELRRLLALYRMSIGPRRRAPLAASVALLRIEHPVGRGWHYAVVDGMYLLDPARDKVRQLKSAALSHRDWSWYRVEWR